MQHAIVVCATIGCRTRRLLLARRGQRIAEAEKQPQGVELGQVAGGRVPLRNKLLRIGGGPERRLQFGKGIVVEAEICGNEFLFQNGGAGEQHHGGPLRLVVGDQQHFAFALKKSSGDVTGDIFGESDGAIVERDMKGGALESHFADVVDPRFVQPCTA